MDFEALSEALERALVLVDPDFEDENGIWWDFVFHRTNACGHFIDAFNCQLDF